MKFSVQNHTVVITELPEEFVDLTQELLDHTAQWQNCHIILEVGDSPLAPELIIEALGSVLKTQKSANKSFVLVDQPQRLKQYPEGISAAPTQEEAFDLIEMEEIERDLGF